MQVHQCPVVQKQEELLCILAPSKPCQGNVYALEDAVYTACKDAIIAESAFGELLRGPNLGTDIPAPLPTWTKAQLTSKNIALDVLGANSVTADCALVGSMSAHARVALACALQC